MRTLEDRQMLPNRRRHCRQDERDATLPGRRRRRHRAVLNQLVRLLGIDAPDRGQTCDAPEEQEAVGRKAGVHGHRCVPPREWRAKQRKRSAASTDRKRTVKSILSPTSIADFSRGCTAPSIRPSTRLSTGPSTGTPATTRIGGRRCSGPGRLSPDRQILDWNSIDVSRTKHRLADVDRSGWRAPAFRRRAARLDRLSSDGRSGSAAPACYRPRHGEGSGAHDRSRQRPDAAGLPLRAGGAGGSRFAGFKPDLTPGKCSNSACSAAST